MYIVVGLRPSPLSGFSSQHGYLLFTDLSVSLPFVDPLAVTPLSLVTSPVPPRSQAEGRPCSRATKHPLASRPILTGNLRIAR